MQIVVDDIPVEVLHRAVRNIRLTVYPDGRVRLVVPWHTTSAAVQSFLQSKSDWLRQHYTRAISRPQPPQKQYLTAEQHLLFGTEFPLRVEYVSSRTHGVVLMNNTLVMFCSRDSTRQKREALLHDFYRRTLSQYLHDRLKQYCTEFAEDEVSFSVRRMKTEWGSCMAVRRSLLFNLSLACVDKSLIDYVIVHELCHLQVQNHSRQFWQLVESRMPDYKIRKQTLNSLRACL